MNHLMNCHGEWNSIRVHRQCGCGFVTNLEVNMTNDIKIVVSKDYRDTKSKEEHIADYIESLVAIEEAMEPYKEQKRDLKKNTLRNNGLLKRNGICLFVLFVYSKTI